MSISSKLRERIGYALSPGGASATAWWLVKKLTGIEVYRLVACNPDAKEPGRFFNTPRFQFASVRTLDDVPKLSVRVVEQLQSHTSQDVYRLVSTGSSLHFFTDAEEVVCQLVVSDGVNVKVDTPNGLRLGLGSNSAFVSYVYTNDSYRRRGAARELLRRVEQDLASRGARFVVAHVSATNVPSLEAFRRAGWERIGMMGFANNGRLLFSRQRSGQPITMQSVLK